MIFDIKMTSFQILSYLIDIRKCKQLKRQNSLSSFNKLSAFFNAEFENNV